MSALRRSEEWYHYVPYEGSEREPEYTCRRFIPRAREKQCFVTKLREGFNITFIIQYNLVSIQYVLVYDGGMKNDGEFR